MVALMFATLAGGTIAESGISALFFDRIGTRSLPAMYLAQGATGFVAMLVLTGSLARFERRRAYVVIPVLIAVIALVERAILVTDPAWIYPVLWLTITVAQLLQAVFLWGSAGTVTDTRAAKRLFPLFGAGGILGAVAGGFATRPLAAAIGAENLLLVWAAALGCSAVLCAAALGVRRPARVTRGRLRRRPQSAFRDIAQGLSYVRRSPLLVWMTAAGVLFSVLFFSLYLPFAQAATVRFPDPERLAGFLGIFWASVTAVAFLVSILLTNRLLGWFGAAAMIIVLPILYAGSFGVLLASSSFATLVSVRFGVNLWLLGVCSPAWETLTNVVPETRRDQVRAFMNGGPTQIGTVIAGVIALVGQQALTTRQLSLIGLGVAVITIAVAWRIRRSYTGALVDALRAGRPSVFEGGAVRTAPVVLGRDGQALRLALEATADPDPRVRRLAVEMLSADPVEAPVRTVLVDRAQDEDAIVRANAIRGLGRAGAIDAPILERALVDDDPAVRLSAVAALGDASGDLTITSRLEDLARDATPSVAARACTVLLTGPSRNEAVGHLRRLLAQDDPEVRIATVREMGSAATEDVLSLVGPMLADDSSAVRAQVLWTLATSAPESAIPAAIEALEHDDGSVRHEAFAVLSGLDLRAHTDTLLRSAQEHGRLAARDHEVAGRVPSDGEASELLRAALLDRGRSHAVVALSALALVSEERDAMRAALDNLRGTEPTQLANALETFETTEHRSLARPLLRLWEPVGASTDHADDWLEIVSLDPDPLIVSCVELVRTTGQAGDVMARSRTSMAPMERVLELRKVALFAELSPADLQRVAGIAEERAYTDGDVIAGEGELGDELHILLTGTVVVVRGDAGASAPVARRGPGDVVGEMSIITHSPRMASLVAEGDVRTLRIGHREFESMIRERPDVSLAVMRVLAERLSAETSER